MNLTGSTIAITGGTSGIGLELVKQLTDQCETIVVIARNQEVLTSLQHTYPNVYGYACNIDNKSELEITLDQIIQQHPKLSIFINNAAIQHVPTFLEDDFNYGGIEKEVKVNLLAPMWITALVLGHFTNQTTKTAFINVSSGLAFYPKTSAAVYSATKAALHSFCTSLRYQLADTQVEVFEAVMPIVDTPMTTGRGRKKISAGSAARALIKGVRNNQHTVYIGLSKYIPFISRLSPSLMANILKRS